MQQIRTQANRRPRFGRAGLAAALIAVGLTLALGPYAAAAGTEPEAGEYTGFLPRNHAIDITLQQGGREALFGRITAIHGKIDLGCGRDNKFFRTAYFDHTTPLKLDQEHRFSLEWNLPHEGKLRLKGTFNLSGGVSGTLFAYEQDPPRTTCETNGEHHWSAHRH
ncbi:MAG TPA: hypothetical protein VGH24_03170 [Solirubrobacteraceae bacterium]